MIIELIYDARNCPKKFTLEIGSLGESFTLEIALDHVVNL
jgi:hypothetical protein